ncbi:Probable crossover junction endonuclease mus81, partial [Durusdinium trenchii]
VSASNQGRWRAVGLKRAANSLAAHPVALRSAAEFTKLKGIGTGIAFALETERRRLDDSDPPASQQGSGDTMQSTTENDNGDAEASTGDGRKKKRRRKLQMPAKSTIRFAIMEVLFQKRFDALDFGRIVKRVNETREASGKQKAPLASLKSAALKLETQNIVNRDKRASGLVIYTLSEEGIKMMEAFAAKNSWESSLADSEQSEAELHEEKNASARAKPRGTERLQDGLHEGRLFTFTPINVSNVTPAMSRADGSRQPQSTEVWELVFLLDNREMVNKTNRLQLLSKLIHAGIPAESRGLALGDMMWIFRRLKSREEGDVEEYVSDYIIERKQIEDLCASIRDGRYNEQKRRLHMCKVPNVIYLVEGELGRGGKSVVSPQALALAMAETQVRDGFILQETATAAATVQFIARMHKLILSMTVKAPAGRWQGPDMSDWRNYAQFLQNNSKPKLATVGEIFGAQLKQINGMSGPKTAAVTAKHPTPRHLVDLFDNKLGHVPESYRECHFQNVAVAGQNRRIGPVVSRRIHDAFTIK